MSSITVSVDDFAVVDLSAGATLTVPDAQGRVQDRLEVAAACRWASTS